MCVLWKNTDLSPHARFCFLSLCSQFQGVRLRSRAELRHGSPSPLPRPPMHASSPATIKVDRQHKIKGRDDQDDQNRDPYLGMNPESPGG